jgi:hypothetical protein
MYEQAEQAIRAAHAAVSELLAHIDYDRHASVHLVLDKLAAAAMWLNVLKGEERQIADLEHGIRQTEPTA